MVFPSTLRSRGALPSSLLRGRLGPSGADRNHAAAARLPASATGRLAEGCRLASLGVSSLAWNVGVLAAPPSRGGWGEGWTLARQRAGPGLAPSASAVPVSPGQH